MLSTTNKSVVENLSFIQMIERNVAQQPFSRALQTENIDVDYDQLWLEVNRVRKTLNRLGVKKMALAIKNSAPWIVFDLAALKEGITVIPIPHFFSEIQIQHLIEDANVDIFVSDLPCSLKSWDSDKKIPISVLGSEISLFSPKSSGLNDDNQRPTKANYDSDHICKISYTSGSTGAPKGIDITWGSINNTVLSLMTVIGKPAAQRHLCALPFSLLLQNIAGVYTVLACGGCCLVPDLSSLGLTGSSKLDVSKFSDTIDRLKPTSIVTVPALLDALVYSVSRLNCDTSSLLFIAVGGAPVSKKTLNDSLALNLPVYQGYGMTECGSVVCLNRAGSNNPGSVGKPLPHISIEIEDEEEIVIYGEHFGLDNHSTHSKYSKRWETGDLGYFDEFGYLHVTARKSSVFCTAYGRNLAPEWVECELNTQLEISQSIVFGEGQTKNIAIIVPSSTDIEDTFIANAVKRANEGLPDYATIGEWIRTDKSFNTENNQLNPSGTLNRNQIFADYEDQINLIFNSLQAKVHEIL